MSHTDLSAFTRFVADDNQSEYPVIYFDLLYRIENVDPLLGNDHEIRNYTTAVAK
jgi:hypothetical protein